MNWDIVSSHKSPVTAKEKLGWLRLLRNDLTMDAPGKWIQTGWPMKNIIGMHSRPLTHKAYLHLENIYHSPYVIEYWSMKRGLPFIAELYRQGKREDPVMTYKRMTGIDSGTILWWNIRPAVISSIGISTVWKETRPYANQYTCKLNSMDDNWYQITPENCPENYGFNAILSQSPNRTNCNNRILWEADKMDSTPSMQTKPDGAME